MKILYVTYGLPAPPCSGARLRDFNLITRASRHHEVSVLALLESAEETRHYHLLEPCCSRVGGVVADRGWAGALAVAARGLLTGRPAATAPYYYPELARLLTRWTSETAFDIVQFEHSFFVPYRDALAPGFSGKTIVDLHNVGVGQYRTMFETVRGRERITALLKWLAMIGWEAPAIDRFDHAIAVSGRDRRRLARLGVKREITVVENGVDCTKLQALEAAGPGTLELLFVGVMGYLPNRDAVRHFCRDILPLVRASRPDCRLTVVGSGGREHLGDLDQPGVVEIADRADELEPYYRRSHVVVVPLRSGGGSRLKILEAMALGRPVVSTAIGCEGLDLEVGKDVLTAEDPKSFARQVLRLADDRQCAESLARAARKKVEMRYHWDLPARELLAVYDSLVPAETSCAEQDAAPGDAAPRLSVVIAVYNMKKDLELCLEALDRSRMRDFQLIIVDDHSDDGSDLVAKSKCDLFLRQDRNRGASAARNLGVQHALARFVFFLDADVLVEPDTLGQVLESFEREPGISALFCSYQHDTLHANFPSQYKNLLHHYTHQTSNREAATFCGGFGAIRRDVFLELGGFDESHRAMEDVELGYRLHRGGHRIRLCPHIQLTHTKHYSLAGLVRSDLCNRAIPWTRLMLDRRMYRADLNTGHSHVASVLVVGLMLLAPLLLFKYPLALLAVEAVMIAALTWLNRYFLVFLGRVRGPGFAARSVFMLILQYGYSGLGVAIGGLGHLRGRVMAALKGRDPGKDKDA